MGAALSLAPAPSISYALTHRPGAGEGIDIVLELFRGTERALTRTVASVKPHELAPVVLACRRYLERRGAQAARAKVPAREHDAESVAAFDWLFAG